MKKHVKRGLTILLILLQLCCLCGCRALDEMRKNQVFYDQSGQIRWNGSVYKALPYCEYLVVDTGYDTVYVTADNVPVLLSSIFSLQELYVSTDSQFLVNYGEEETYYCKEADYEALCARLEAPFEPDILCYSYEELNEDTFEYEYIYYTLTEEQAAAVRQITQTAEPKTMEEGFLLDYDWSLFLESCSADMLLRRIDMEIAVSGEKYYLVAHEEEQTLVYTVPETLKATFDQIVSTYKQTEEYLWMTEDEFIFE